MNAQARTGTGPLWWRVFAMAISFAAERRDLGSWTRPGFAIDRTAPGWTFGTAMAETVAGIASIAPILPLFLFGMPACTLGAAALAVTARAGRVMRVLAYDATRPDGRRLDALEQRDLEDLARALAERAAFIGALAVFHAALPLALWTFGAGGRG